MPAPPPGSLASDALPPDQPAIGINPPSFAQSFKSSYDAVSRTQAIGAQWNNQADWMDDRLNEYQQKTGEKLTNPLRLAGINDQSIVSDAEQTNREKFAKAGMTYPSEQDISAGGIDKARRAGQADAVLSAGPQTLSSRLGSLAGGMAETANPVDQPFNAAAMALAPEGSLLLRAAGVGAGFGLATGAQGALTYGYQHQVNPAVTPGSIAGEAVSAGLQGAGMEFGLGALGAAWRRLTATAPEAASRAPLAAHDAGVIAEKAEDIQAQQPFQGTSASVAHADAVAATEKAITEQKPVELPLSAQREAEARRGQIFYPGGSADVRYDLAEARDLITSHDADGRINPNYPPELQPRDRTTAASLDQVNSIASRFEPERMAPNSDANHGPPIVGPDNVVESGNGRTAAIRQVYAGGTDAEYRGWLDRSGYDTTGMREPVLVARRTTPMESPERAQFAQSLTGSGLRLNATEQALSDARHLSPQAISDAKTGEVDSASNRDFVRGFLSKAPQEEHGAMTTAAGTLSANGKRRLEAALIARAYGDPGVVTRLYDHPDPNIKTLGYALRESAIPWAKMRDAAATGEIAAGHDLTQSVMQAVRDVMRARDDGRPIWEVMNQADFFRSDLEQQVARMFFKDNEMTRLAGQKSIAENLKDYAEGSLHNTAGPRLFGEAMKPGEVLSGALAKRGAEEPHTADLIDMATSKEALAKPKLGEPEAARQELERMRDQGKNLMFTRDADGKVAQGVIDAPMAELDGIEAMAKEVRACSMPPAEAAE